MYSYKHICACVFVYPCRIFPPGIRVEIYVYEENIISSHFLTSYTYISICIRHIDVLYTRKARSKQMLAPDACPMFCMYVQIYDDIHVVHRVATISRLLKS